MALAIKALVTKSDDQSSILGIHMTGENSRKLSCDLYTHAMAMCVHAHKPQCHF